MIFRCLIGFGGDDSLEVQQFREIGIRAGK